MYLDILKTGDLKTILKMNILNITHTHEHAFSLM